jgi:hypothetical protein
MGYIIALPVNNTSALFIRMSPRMRIATTERVRHAHVFQRVEDAEDILSTCNTTWRRYAKIKKKIGVRAYTQEPPDPILNGDFQLAFPEQTANLHQVDVA